MSTRRRESHPGDAMNLRLTPPQQSSDAQRARGTVRTVHRVAGGHPARRERVRRAGGARTSAPGGKPSAEYEPRPCPCRDPRPRREACASASRSRRQRLPQRNPLVAVERRRVRQNHAISRLQPLDDLDGIDRGSSERTRTREACCPSASTLYSAPSDCARAITGRPTITSVQALDIDGGCRSACPQRARPAASAPPARR